MAVLALVVLVAWLLLVAVARGYLHYRRTGEVSAPARAEPRSPQWWARLISSLGIGFAVAAPVAELVGFAPIAVLDHSFVRYAGLVIAVVGIVGTLGAQQAMGASWRPDIDPSARTPLVTNGPFRLVRNPVLTCTVTTAGGLALMVPNPFSVVMLAAVVTGIQIQVRLVEEPHLARVHGDDYRQYAARTGRFLPWIGRGQPGPP